MILELHDEDLQPEYQTLPTEQIEFRHFRQPAQLSVAAAGAATFYRGHHTDHETEVTIKPPKFSDRNRDRMYILVSAWSWDRRHYEMASVTLEAQDGQRWYEDIISSGSEEEQRSLVSALQRIADNQNGSLMQPHARLVALFAVMEWNGPQLDGLVLTRHASNVFMPEVWPLCTFEGDIIVPANSL